MLGSRGVLWRIALKRCVTVRTPRSKARWASAAVASVWPAETVMPRAHELVDQLERAGQLGRERDLGHGRGVEQAAQQRQVGQREEAGVVHARPAR